MSIDKLPSGSWRVRVEVGRDSNGKRIRRAGTFKTKREAQAAEHLWFDLNRTNSIVKDKISLVDFIAERYLPYVEQKVRYNTLRGYKRDINNYILPCLANVNIQDITVNHVQKMINSCTTYKIAKNARDTLRQILNVAVNDEYIQKNPAASRELVLPKRDIYPDEHNGDWLTTFTEHDAFIASIDDEKYKIVTILGLSLGLRVGEVFGLNWEHIDFENRLVHVCQTYVKEKSGYKLMPPKTKMSDRYIPLRKTTAEYLYSIYSALGCPEGAVVTDSSGVRQNPHAYTISWLRYLKRTGLKHVTLLNMRHSFATACLNAGIDISHVSKMLGHTSIEITMNRYVRFKSQNLVDVLDSAID